MAEKDKLGEQTLTSDSFDRNKSRRGILHSVIVIFIALLIVFVVSTGVFYFAVKNNINGLAEKLEPQLINRPILRLFLPEKFIPQDPDDPKYLSEKEIINKYNEYRTMVSELNIALESANNTISELRKEIENYNDMEKLIEENQALLSSIEEENADLEFNIQTFSEMLVKGNTESFKEYFEKIDKATAAVLYEKVLIEDSKLEDKRQLAKSFAAMDPRSAANVLTELYNQDKEKAADIFEGMEDTPRALILERMDAKIGAQITVMLSDRKLSRYSID
ncbi:MAG: hypothetical protein GX957_04655 [Clostridiaceae bacterium]|nr:hypothetical protein [Clostridiaceae bacterium]